VDWVVAFTTRQLALEGSNARHAGAIVVGVATMIVASTASGNLT